MLPCRVAQHPSLLPHALRRRVSRRSQISRANKAACVKKSILHECPQRADLSLLHAQKSPLTQYQSYNFFSLTIASRHIFSTPKSCLDSNEYAPYEELNGVRTKRTSSAWILLRLSRKRRSVRSTRRRPGYSLVSIAYVDFMMVTQRTAEVELKKLQLGMIRQVPQARNQHIIVDEAPIVRRHEIRIETRRCVLE